MSLITHDKAWQLGLKDIHENKPITKVGKTIKHLTTKQYVVPLTDEIGHEWIVYVYGMEEITTETNKVNASEQKRIFGFGTRKCSRSPSWKC